LGTVYFFLKVGAFTFGGGYAMIPLIQKEALKQPLDFGKRYFGCDCDCRKHTPADAVTGHIVGYRVAGFWQFFFYTRRCIASFL
jgi:hypothetical protein